MIVVTTGTSITAVVVVMLDDVMVFTIVVVLTHDGVWVDREELSAVPVDVTVLIKVVVEWHASPITRSADRRKIDMNLNNIFGFNIINIFGLS